MGLPGSRAPAFRLAAFSRSTRDPGTPSGCGLASRARMTRSPVVPEARVAGTADAPAAPPLKSPVQAVPLRGILRGAKWSIPSDLGPREAVMMTMAAAPVPTGGARDRRHAAALAATW